jgi:hypothetical protein
MRMMVILVAVLMLRDVLVLFVCNCGSQARRIGIELRRTRRRVLIHK